MTLRQYILTMLLATVLCWAAVVFVILNVDPFQSGSVGFIFFYTSLFLALLGSISILAFFIYKLIGDRALPMFRHVQASFKHAVLFAIFIVTFLFLQGKNLLNFWNTMVLLSVFVLILSFTVSLKKRDTGAQLQSID